MMKFVIKFCTFSNSLKNYCSESRDFRVLSNPMRTITSKSNPKDATLYSRLAPIKDPNVSMIPILDQWVREGKSIDPKDVHSIIKLFRRFKRFKHALQISQWTSDKKLFDALPRDVSVRLDLISKVHGLKEAEEYFDGIPSTERVWQIYGALLKCYADAKSLEKAEATMQKIKESGNAKTLSYNIMLNLYSQMGEHKKFDPLLQEMEEEGIICDKYTYSIRLNAYAASSNIEQMEKLLTKMESDPVVSKVWNAYAIAANSYLKAGSLEKALVSLRKSESLIKISNWKSDYEVLLTLYASVGSKDDVYRIWNFQKKHGKFYNMSYLCMMSALDKLEDLDGAEKIFEEWESGKTFFDYKLPNFLITAYCKRGLLERAESFVNQLIESGREPNADTWSRLAFGYFKINQMDKAVETKKKSISASYPGWRPNIATLAFCLDYLNEKGDIDMADDIKRSLHEKGLFSSDMNDRLVGYSERVKAGPKAFFDMGGEDQVLEVERLKA